MKKINSQSIIIRIIIIAIIIISIISLSIFIINNSKNKNKLDNKNVQNENRKKIYAVGFNSIGQIELIDIQQNKIIKTDDLKKYLKEIPKVKVKKETKQLIEFYNNFIKTKVVVKRGDNAWKIQKSLTPNENIGKMLKYVEKINGRKLHPIYSNETLYFLKDKSKNNTQEQIVEEFVEVDPIFTFSFNKEEQKLYACEVNSKNIYLIELKNNNILVSLVKEKLNIDKIDEFKVYKNNFYFIDKNNKKLYIVNQNNEYKTINLNNIPINWEVINNEIFYVTNDKYIYKLTKDGVEQKIEVGDISKQIYVQNNKLYVLNNFGSGRNKNILFEIEPKKFKVLGWYQLNSNKTNLIVNSFNNELYVYQERTEENNNINVLIKLHSSNYDKLEEIKLNEEQSKLVAEGKTNVIENYLIGLNGKELKTINLNIFETINKINISSNNLVIISK